jgi:transposase
MKAICVYNNLFTAWGTKLYAMVPMYDWNAKYVTIDTDGLYALLGRRSGTGLTLPEFVERRQEFWQLHFNFPDKLFAEITADVKRLGFTISTDGVGASVHLFKWRWVRRYEETPTERKQRLLRQREEARKRFYSGIQVRADEEDLKWVGVDPGRKNMVTAATLDGERWSYKMTTKQYHHLIKGNDKKSHRQHLIVQNGLEQRQGYANRENSLLRCHRIQSNLLAR